MSYDNVLILAPNLQNISAIGLYEERIVIQFNPDRLIVDVR